MMLIFRPISVDLVLSPKVSKRLQFTILDLLLSFLLRRLVEPCHFFLVVSDVILQEHF